MGDQIESAVNAPVLMAKNIKQNQRKHKPAPISFQPKTSHDLESDFYFYPNYFSTLLTNMIPAHCAYGNAKGPGWGDLNVLKKEWEEDPQWPLEDHLQKRLNNKQLRLLSASELQLDPELFTKSGFYKKQTDQTYAMAFAARDGDKLYLAFRGSSTRHHFINVVSQGEYEAFYPLYGDFVHAITQYIQKNNIKDVTVSGHSMGGAVSLMTLQQYKSNITSLAKSGVNFHFTLIAPTKNKDNINFPDLPDNVRITRICNLEDISTSQVWVKNSDWSRSNIGFKHLNIESIVPKIKGQQSFLDALTKPLISATIKKINDYSGINHDCRKYIRQIEALSKIPLYGNPYDYIHSFIDVPNQTIDYQLDKNNHVYVFDVDTSNHRRHFTTLKDGSGDSVMVAPGFGHVVFYGNDGVETVFIDACYTDVQFQWCKEKSTIDIEQNQTFSLRLEHVENVVFNDRICTLLPNPKNPHQKMLAHYKRPHQGFCFDPRKHYEQQLQSRCG